MKHLEQISENTSPSTFWCPAAVLSDEELELLQFYEEFGGGQLEPS